MKSRGGLLIVCIFSFVFSSCSSSNSHLITFRDSVVEDLKIQFQFGNFIDAQAMSIDAFGNIYIVDAGAPGIYKFTSIGDSLRGVAGFGSEHNQFDDPRDVDASLTNSVAVADRNNHRIEIYSKDLIWQATLEGHGPGSKFQFGYPKTLCTSSAGNYILLEEENKRVVVLWPDRSEQRTLSLSGAESGSALMPVAVALSWSKFITVADLNSRSLIIFNEIFLLQRRINYPVTTDLKLIANGDIIFILSKNLAAIPLLEASTLAYKGSYRTPIPPNQLRGISVYKNACYLLTKEKVIVCSMQ